MEQFVVSLKQPVSQWQGLSKCVFINESLCVFLYRVRVVGVREHVWVL